MDFRILLALTLLVPGCAPNVTTSGEGSREAGTDTDTATVGATTASLTSASSSTGAPLTTTGLPSSSGSGHGSSGSSPLCDLGCGPRGFSQAWEVRVDDGLTPWPANASLSGWAFSASGSVQLYITDTSGPSEQQVRLLGVAANGTNMRVLTEDDLQIVGGRTYGFSANQDGFVLSRWFDGDPPTFELRHYAADGTLLCALPSEYPIRGIVPQPDGGWVLHDSPRFARHEDTCSDPVAWPTPPLAFEQLSPTVRYAEWLGDRVVVAGHSTDGIGFGGYELFTATFETAGGTATGSSVGPPLPTGFTADWAGRSPDGRLMVSGSGDIATPAQVFVVDGDSANTILFDDYSGARLTQPLFGTADAWIAFGGDGVQLTALEASPCCSATLETDPELSPVGFARLGDDVWVVSREPSLGTYWVSRHNAL